MSDYFEFLRSVYFFKDLSDEDLRVLAELCGVEAREAQSVLFRENDAADKFYVVMDGSVEVWKNHGSSEAVLLAIQGQGSIFGEMALVDDLSRSATVVTHQPSSFIYFQHQDFSRVMRERSSLTLSILRSLSRIVRTSNDVFIQNLSQQNRELQTAYRDLKAAQDELIRTERFSTLGRFASFILHDLRNPIAMIRAIAEMIGYEVPEDSPIHEFSGKIIQEADFVNRFANELLDYSRGEIRLNYAPTSIDSIFAKLKGNLEEVFEKKELRLEFRNEMSQSFVADEDRLVRAFLNLADNARKATDRGGRVCFSARAEGRDLRIDVEDSGEGMSPEVMARVFEPFYSSSSKGGTGLGMVIVKNVVEAHHGRIELDSSPGKGTKISVSLPQSPPLHG